MAHRHDIRKDGTLVKSEENSQCIGKTMPTDRTRYLSGLLLSRVAPALTRTSRHIISSAGKVRAQEIDCLKFVIQFTEMYDGLSTRVQGLAPCLVDIVMRFFDFIQMMYCTQSIQILQLRLPISSSDAPIQMS